MVVGESQAGAAGRQRGLAPWPVAVEDITVRLGHRVVLNNLSFTVSPGEFVAVIGPNGAGKSTLLRLLLGLLRPVRGTVRLFGNPVRRGVPGVGYVPQHFQLPGAIPLRGREVVALGIDGAKYGPHIPSRAKSRRVQEVLEEVRADAYADVPIWQISGGEQQRLMLAQALVGNPRLLLLDEPLANLDLRSRQEVVALVAEVCRSRHIATLFVAHDINPLLHVADRVLYLANGHGVIGAPEEVVRADVLSGLFGVPVCVVRAEGVVLVAPGGTSHA